MPWAAAAAWKSGDDYHRTRGCAGHHDGRKYSSWDRHCAGDFHEGAHKGRGRRTRFHCASACGNKIQYARGARGHPCAGASQIKGIPVNVTGHDHVRLRGRFNNAPGAFWCHYHDNANTMVAASRRRENNAGGQGGNSVYNQLIFGIRNLGRYHDSGYCSNISRLRHKVHHDGRTCYQMIQGKLGATRAKVKAIQYCQRHRTDPKCKCINVADAGFIARCKRHRNWAGCKEILESLSAIQKTGLSSASGLFGNADCLVPGICAGDVFEPNTRITSCANKMAICTQVMKLDNIRAAAGLKAAQACNINFEAEQRKKDAAKATARKRAADAAAARKRAADAAARKRAADAAAARRRGSRRPSPSPSGGGSPSPRTSPSVAGTRSSLPGPLAKVSSRTGLGDRGVAIAGSAILVSCCVMLLVLLLVGGEGGPPVPPPPRRYRG